MKKQNLLKLFILVTAVLSGTVEAFATATAVQTLSVDAPPAVAINKLSSGESGDINPETGTHGGLNASFEITVNGTDEDYILIVGSKMTAAGGVEESAFSDDGQALLFGRADREDAYPTAEAIVNAKAGGSNNSNVIAYQISTMDITSPMTVEYSTTQENLEGNKGCYIIHINGAQESTLTQTISGTPYGSTYSNSQDSAGRYSATVYITAISK